MATYDDSLVRFLVEGTRVRGGLVHLDETWRTLAGRRDYEQGPLSLLGQAAAAAALLAATIKFRGSMIVQATGGTHLGLLVVEATGERTLRGLVRLHEGAPRLPRAEALLDAGRLAITIDPGEGGERYQGIVALEGETLARSLEGYFERSEQIETRLWLAADGQRASGLLIQEMPAAPGASDQDDDAWNRCVHLASTITDGELLHLEPHAVLERLFHQERVRVFQPERWRFRCGCSRERVRSVLRAMGREELESILAEEGRIGVDCEFCGAAYRFDTVDFDEVFEGPEVSHDVGSSMH